MNRFLPMRDEAVISHLSRTMQEDGTVCYFFGDTTIRAAEMHTAGRIHLTPISGNQVACGKWVDLDEQQAHRYCEQLSQHLNSGELSGMDVG